MYTKWAHFLNFFVTCSLFWGRLSELSVFCDGIECSGDNIGVPLLLECNDGMHSEFEGAERVLLSSI